MNAIRDPTGRMKSSAETLMSIFCFGRARPKCMRTIVQFLSKRLRFQTRSRANRTKAGEESANAIVDLARKTIGQASLARIDYVDLVDAKNLLPIEVVRPNSLLALAVFFGQTRLIDNILVG